MSIFDAYVRLEGTLSGSAKCDELMSRHTSYRIGGPAALFVECASVADLALTLEVLAEEGVAWTIVGKGSNLLVSDAGYDGAVIVLAGEFARIDFGGLTEEEIVALPAAQRLHVTAGAAVPLARLVQQAYGLGLSGLEDMAGIPGSLGGAIFMNAGTRESWIASRVAHVTAYRPGTGLHIIYADEIDWTYRSSNISADEIIVEATLALKAANKGRIAETMQDLLDARSRRQPLSAHSCGSVFKNPDGKSAGELIRSCGLAGASCGDAHISTLHSNFIVNDGSARADDVLALMRLARDRVKESYGISLSPEVKFLGFPF